MKQYQLTEVVNNILVDFQAGLHTQLIAKVTKVNATTINCVPVIARLVDGKKVVMSEFANVPPVFQQGGTSSQTFPIAVNDYCLLLVSERCFDGWYNGQDFQLPVEYRMHSYSDCFAIVGVNPMSKALPIPTKITTTGDQIINGDVTFTGSVTQTGNIDLTGNLDVTGDITQHGAMAVTGNVVITGNLSVTGIISINGIPGYNGTFTTADARTATVVSGIITTVV